MHDHELLSVCSDDCSIDSLHNDKVNLPRKKKTGDNLWKCAHDDPIVADTTLTDTCADQ